MSDAKYDIAFYQTSGGECQIWDFLENLRIKAASSKDARIQHKQVSLYMELLKLNGTNMNENIKKHLEEDIWELRPGNNRVFYFFVEKDAVLEKDTFILLHQFRKKSQKTPRREIEQAKRERDDYLSRKENGEL